VLKEGISFNKNMPIASQKVSSETDANEKAEFDLDPFISPKRKF
jgi:hypothetical protein